MTTCSGGAEGEVDTGANPDRSKDALLANSHGSADDENTCSASSGKSVLQSSLVLDPRPGSTSLIKGPCPPAESHSRPSVDSVDYAPPVTARTLQVLDLQRVINDARLRHDINFDPCLHFRPNTDARRRERKCRDADAYWAALREELEWCAGFGRWPLQEAPTVPPRIQRVLVEIREVLRTLVPEREVQMVDDTLDLTLLVQQISRSRLDYDGLAQWMARVLKAHCAPMRDAWVDEMAWLFRRAAQEGNQGLLVDGIRALFGILEAMKLVRSSIA